MAGINRLGKGPAKPGTMRPADPNKYKTMDIFSEGTEGDKDYARMVQDIEDTQQNHSGWLFGRGAFDKGDLLYLRDEEEKRRFAEQELRESELRSFARMRQKTEALPDDDDTAADILAEKEKKARSQADIVKSLLRVKAAPKVKVKQESEEPAAKRIKSEPTVPIKAEPGVSIKAEPAVKDEPGRVKEEAQNSGDEGNANGLTGLLGGYGSESDEETTTPKEAKSDRGVQALPLPESFLKREPTVDVLREVKHEEPPPWNGNNQANESDSSDSSSS